MNIGIIGCGAISSQYMVGFDKNKNDVNVLACADLDNEKSKLFAKEYNIEHLTVNNLFSNPDIDIVLKKVKNKKCFKEKPKIKFKINAGVYILSKKYAIKFFRMNKNKFINMTDIYFLHQIQL